MNHPKRGRGRPKGSLNQSTIERRRQEEMFAQQTKKRGPGRPKGTKNKISVTEETPTAVGEKTSTPTTTDYNNR